jgi:hypothetical protein
MTWTSCTWPASRMARWTNRGDRGMPKRPDFGFMQELYRRVLQEFPPKTVDIMMVPLPGLLDLPLLDKLGLNEISINIEVFSETNAKQVMRHKYNQGLDFYLVVTPTRGHKTSNHRSDSASTCGFSQWT